MRPSILKNKAKDTKLDAAIILYPKVLSDDLCNAIVNEYKDSDLWKPSAFYNGSEFKSNLRESSEIQIGSTADTVYRQELDKEIFCAVGHCLEEYTKLYVSLAEQDVGYTLLRYEKGQYIAPHLDTSNDLGRILSLSILLNNDFDGGRFMFWGGDLTIPKEKGSVLMFPSNLMYPHEVTPIDRGTRYSIVTWIK